MARDMDGPRKKELDMKDGVPVDAEDEDDDETDADE